MRRSTAPRCSVVMPVYNTPEPYLREAIESILQQSFKDLELLIVDDCSRPYVQEIVESYADERVRYFRLENQSGAAVARNHALDAARGEYIAFMDADDISLPERLQKQVDYLDAHPEISCLGTSYKYFDGKSYKKAPGVPHDHEGIESYLLFCGCAFCQSSVMLRRSVLEEYSIRYRPEYKVAQDCALWFDLIGKARFATLGEELVHYRLHPHSISRRSLRQQVRNMAEAQAALLERSGGFAFENKETWLHLLEGATLTHQEYAEISQRLIQVAEALQAQQGSAAPGVKTVLRQRVRKAFLRTRSIRGQWELLGLPLRKYVELPLWWCLFCFITKGLLCRQHKTQEAQMAR